MAKITYDNKSYLNQNGSVPNVNKVNDTDMNEIKTVVNTNYDAMIDELYYKANDTFEVGSSGGTTYSIYPGFVSASTTNVLFSITTTKRLDNINTITINSLELVLRGGSGYLNSSSGFTEYKGASGYTLSATIRGEREIVISVLKSSAFTNVSNNTPVIVGGHIKLTFS